MCRQHPVNLLAAFHRYNPLQALRSEDLHNRFALRQQILVLEDSRSDHQCSTELSVRTNAASV
jgi:hypothetical protein